MSLTVKNTVSNQAEWPEKVDPEEVGADPALLQKALDFIAAEVQGGTVPGAILAATRHGQLFIEQAWGGYIGDQSASREDLLPLDPTVRVMFYSFTKPTTATVVALLQQSRLLDYDAPLRSYIPEFSGGGKETITLRHLLTHSAGIPNSPSLPVYTEALWRQAITTLCAMPVEWQPGSRTYYHAATGMLLAAEAVRRVSGRRPWEEIVRQRLFEPLGMTQTTLGFPPPAAKVAFTPRPTNYPCKLDAARSQSGAEYQFIGHPAGGAIGTVSDMLRLLNFHLNQGRWQGKIILQAANCREMQRVQYQQAISEALAAGKTPDHEYWGLGWLLRGQTQEGWFGFGNVVSESAFGHAGIDTVIGIADPAKHLALAFVTTDSPPSSEATIRLRNTVTNLVAQSVVM